MATMSPVRRRIAVDAIRAIPPGNGIFGTRERGSSGPEDFHLRALPEPYVNLSIHTAPVVRPFP